MRVKYPQIFIKPEKQHLLSRRHPWVFSNGLQEAKGVTNGAIVDLMSPDGKRFLARGTFNANSQISFRILTRSERDLIDKDFFVRKFGELLEVRKRFINMRETNGFRLVFGESDEMPGLIVDCYANYLVFQIHTMGMEMLRKEIVEALVDVMKPEGIYERSDVGVRTHEGLADQPTGVAWGKEPPQEIEILENNVKLLVNIAKGQKTGMFLDQRENRKALQKYVQGKRLLNCFCYTAGFSVYSALAGAKETVNVDVSGDALETAKRNFEVNKLPLNKHQFIDEDVFKVLEDMEKSREQFDVIVLDPPAFVKNKNSLSKGLSGYRFINEKALRLLPIGGVLVSSSCSAHVSDELFQDMLVKSSQRAGCSLKVLEIRHQPIDHPFNLDFPEGKYLKYYVLLKT